MKLSIVIVSWNVKEKLKDNLQALFQSQCNFEFEVFVVDNDSKDNTVEMVEKEFSQVKLIKNNENLGFAKANNQAIKLAKGEYVLLLNPDMRVFPDTLKNMVVWMGDNQQATVAGCKLLDENYQIVKHVRRFPTLRDQLAIVLKLPHLFPKILNKYLRTDFDYFQPAQVDSIRGGFFMINMGAIERLTQKENLTIPYLDERYFLWFEEVDYCQQIKKAGGEVWYTPAANCIDHVGQSFKQVKRWKTQKYFRDSMLKYFEKWQSKREYRILRVAWPLGMFLTILFSIFRIKSKAKT
ncbi:MAG: glycosyltransferase family 2 protein [Patescibacteria group bacterium]|nr:glycosyltransferase family 2 protein [Patescibacteria group bacterium]MDD4610460.1 glycosyltransferase family 2 protein [Patescibacteria group bacterium]